MDITFAVPPPAGAASLERCPDTIRFLQLLAALGGPGPSAEEAAAELPEMQAARGLFQWQVGSVSDGSEIVYKPSCTAAIIPEYSSQACGGSAHCHTQQLWSCVHVHGKAVCTLQHCMAVKHVLLQMSADIFLLA